MSAPVPIFTIQAGELIISDAASGRTRWRGRPLGAPVSDVKAVPGSDHAVILLDYMAQPSGSFQNLICLDADGRVVWEARLPSTSNTDAYVSFSLAATVVEANSWSGYRASIDIVSGSILSATFAK